VRVADGHPPLVARQGGDVGLPVGGLPGARPAEDVGPRVAGVVQQAQHVVVAEFAPDQLPLVRAVAQPPGEGHALAADGPDGGAGRPGPLEGAEEEADGLLHLPVRVEDDLIALGCGRSW